MRAASLTLAGGALFLLFLQPDFESETDAHLTPACAPARSYARTCPLTAAVSQPGKPQAPMSGPAFILRFAECGCGQTVACCSRRTGASLSRRRKVTALADLS